MCENFARLDGIDAYDSLLTWNISLRETWEINFKIPYLSHWYIGLIKRLPNVIGKSVHKVKQIHPNKRGKKTDASEAEARTPELRITWLVS
ncbi:hypothetical protein WN943_029250 [Citrus x changshan-huyou]